MLVQRKNTLLAIKTLVPLDKTQVAQEGFKAVVGVCVHPTYDLSSNPDKVCYFCVKAA